MNPTMNQVAGGWSLCVSSLPLLSVGIDPNPLTSDPQLAPPVFYFYLCFQIGRRRRSRGQRAPARARAGRQALRLRPALPASQQSGKVLMEKTAGRDLIKPGVPRGLAPRGAPCTPPPARAPSPLGLSGDAGTSEMLPLTAGAHIDGERAGSAWRGPGAEPRIAPSRTPSFPLGASEPGARNPALRGALCPRGWSASARRPRYPCSPAPARRRGRRSIRRKPTWTLETIVFRHRLQCPGHGGCQGTWSVSASRVLRRPSNPWTQSNARNDGYQSLISASCLVQFSKPTRPRASGGGQSGGARMVGKQAWRGRPLPRMRSRRRRRPAHLALPPSPPTRLGPACTGGLCAPASRRRPLPGMGARGAGHKGAPTSSSPSPPAPPHTSGLRRIQREPRTKVLWLSLSGPQAPSGLEPPGGVLLFSSTFGCPRRFHQPTSLVD